jgi:tRNA(adenine34) deaminase
MNRRGALACLCGIGLASLSKGLLAKTSLASIPMKQHETAMRAAIAMAMQNPVYPFGAVITNASDGSILARGVNTTSLNPIFHGEIACMNNYIERYGNQNWSELVLYTTGEPCPMCMSALIWAGISGVVYGSSIKTIRQSQIDQFTYSAKEINASASTFSQTSLIGGVLQLECDALFANRKRTTPINA